MVNNGNDKGRTKHIDVRFHYVREMIENKQIIVEYRPTKEMVADILTKATPKPIFAQLRPNLLGLSSEDVIKKALITINYYNDVFTSRDGVDPNPLP
jgi:hypothetical protein